MAGEELHRLAERVAELPRQVLEDGAERIAKGATERLEAATGGDSSLSHAPAELSVEVDVDGTSATVEAAGGSGQWRWLEEGTAPHLIHDRLHPGTQGQETWSSGIAADLRAFKRDTDEAFQEAFR